MTGVFAGSNKEKGSMILEMAIWCLILFASLVYFEKIFVHSYQGFKKEVLRQNQILRT